MSQTSAGGGVACASDPDETPQSGDEGVSDNIFYRSYTPSNFGYTGDFEAMGVGFVARFVDVGGSNPTVTNSVKLFTTTGTFPNGVLTEVASQDFDVTAADDGELFEVMFDTPFIVDSSTELIVAIDIQANPGPPNNYDFRIGVIDAGQNAPSYLSSTACGLTSPGTFTSINFPDNHLILNLIGDTSLDTDDFLLSQISVYPNPADNILNVKLPSNLILNNASLHDLLGRDTGVKMSNGSMDVAKLSSGIYILNIETTGGSLSQRIIVE